MHTFCKQISSRFRRFTAGGDDVVRACRLGADGVSQNIDFSKRDSAAAGGSEFTGLQIESGGKISAITCSPGVKGCMALTTPSRLKIFDVNTGREFSSKDFEAEGGIHGMCWSPTGATCLAALKNRTIVVHDPRAPSSSAAVFPGHAAVAPNRLAYLKGNHFCSTGKGSGAQLC
jgi:WD40 repeat protein